MAETGYPERAHDFASDAEEQARADASVPQGARGAYIVSATAVGLLILAWLALYFLVFIPRGTVG